MSIKDLFHKNINKFKTNFKSVTSASIDVESKEFVLAKQKEKERFVPPLDFATASNFAKFGSAELYYQFAFQRIYNQYPYDGTLAEKQEFQNSSTDLDRHIFENIYPRTNGFIKLGEGGFDGAKVGPTQFNDAGSNKSYIFIDGGIHTASGGMIKDPYSKTFDKSMIYDVSDGNRKGSSLAFDEKHGCTIEFWMNKRHFDTIKAEREAVFELWNQESTGTSYGKINLNISDTNIMQLQWYSGSVVGTANFSSTGIDFDDKKWHHYAISLFKNNSSMRARMYYDGEYHDEVVDTTNVIGGIRGYSKGLIATIGALVGDPASAFAIGDGKLSASLDEFRYWKKERTPKEIGLNWFDQIGGGTNKHNSNKHLGVYYKFNEGIHGSASVDSVILDYSGRITNGNFVGYTSTARDTGSGLVLSGYVDKEFKDPIIYSTHPTVKKTYERYIASGSQVDLENTSMVYNLLPSWLQREDTESNKNVKFLFQIIGSYFDTLYSQVAHINSIKDKKYRDGTKIAPNVFARDALRGSGFVMPDIFIEADVVEEFRNRDLNEIYAGDITKVKNQIYQNIYNNLLYIYKSKGTEKSFRNFFRCVGFDTELVKLNLYADNSTTVLRDNYEFKSISKPVINFNNPNHFESTIYHSSSQSHLTYLDSSDRPSVASEKYSAMTMECEVILPKKLKRTDIGYFDTVFLTSSIFGFHRALTSSANNYSWHPNDLSMRVYAIRDEMGSDHARFRLSCSVDNIGGSGHSQGFSIDTETYRHVYDNEKWTLAVRVRHKDYPFVNVQGNSTKKEYFVEFYGLSTIGNDIIRGPFLISASLGGSWATEDHGIRALTYAKRMYVGAHRQDFKGSVIERTDVNISQFRFWQSYVSNEDLHQHAFDTTNYGLEHPYEDDNVFQATDSHIPQIDTLGIHWDFLSVSGSDSSGTFVVQDRSSGSADEQKKYDFIGKITKQDNSGVGFGFPANSQAFVEKKFIYAAKKRNPEGNYSSDGVTIVGEKEENFFRDDDANDNYYIFEKSPYAIVSDEMINMFSTVKDFSNAIGAPIHRYRHEYKELTDLRKLFFEKVNNEPDPEHFFEYFKWIDEAISFGIEQLTPAGTKFASSVKNIVESHILERNKYVEKFPFISQKQSTEGNIQGAEQMLYNWQFGHAPIHKNKSELPDNENCLWQKKRRKLGGQADTIRELLYKSNDSKLPRLLKYETGQVYVGNTYKVNQAAKPYKFSGVQKNTIHGGINYDSNKNRLLIHEEIRPHGPTSEYFGMNIPVNVMVVGTGEGFGIVPENVCNDTVDPNEKEKFNFSVILGEYAQSVGSSPNSKHLAEYKFRRKGNRVFPMNLVSASVREGYSKKVASTFTNNVYITNLHSDTVDLTNEVPMQGPFTQTWVGGHQSRHVRLNKHDKSLKTEGGSTTKNNLDDLYSRPEAWRMLLGEHTSSLGADGAFGFTPADYGMDISTLRYPDTAKKRAVRFREEHAKRPVNVKNISHDFPGNRVGNYNKRYEYISVGAGKKEMNLYFRSNSDISNYIPASIRTEGNLSHTTNVMTMVAQTPYLSGNYFGADSNRSPDGQLYERVFGNGFFLDDTFMSDTSFIGYTNGNGFAFSLWIKIPTGELAGTTQQQLISCDTAGGDSSIDILWDNSANNIKLQIKFSDNRHIIVEFPLDIDDDIWRHCVFTFDGVAQHVGPVAANLKLYVNGVEIAQSSISGNIIDDKTASDLRGIGQIDKIGDLDLKVHLDDIAIWDSYLTQAHVTELYNGGNYISPLQHSMFSSNFLVSYYSFDFPTDTTALIQDVNGSNHLAITSVANASFVEGIVPLYSLYVKDVVLGLPSGSFRDSTQKNETVFTTRFSAPGGPEIQTRGYLDAFSGEYSAYNGMPYRNLSVRGRSSGEIGKIRLDTHLGTRDGLKTLLSRHAGRLGRDSEYGYDVVSYFDGTSAGVRMQEAYFWNKVLAFDYEISKGIYLNDTIMNLESGNFTGYTNGNGFTLSFWMKIPEGELPSSSQKYIFRSFGDGGSEASVYVYFDTSSKDITVKIYFQDGNNATAVFTPNVDQKYHHYVVTFSGNLQVIAGEVTSVNNFSLYQDGVSTTRTSLVSSNAGTATYSNNNMWAIDSVRFGDTDLKVMFDDIAIWDEDFTANNVKELYYDGQYFDLTSHSSTFSYLVSWYTFDHASDTVQSNPGIINDNKGSNNLNVIDAINDASLGTEYGGKDKRTAKTSQQFSISMWVHPTDISNLRQLIDFDNQQTALYNDNGQIKFTTKWNNASHTWSTGQTLEAGRWQHIVLSYDASSYVNDPILYVDGRETPWTAPTPSITSTHNWSGFDPLYSESRLYLQIGTRAGTANNFKGYIDEVAIWSRALTLVDVVKIEGNGRQRSLNNIGVKNNLELWVGLGDSTDNRYKIIDSNTRLYDMSGYNRHAYDTDVVLQIHNEGSPSFHKYHRNTNYRISDTSGHLRPDLLIKNDNAHVGSTMPRSTYQYSWVDKTISHEYGIRSGKQRIYGYAPRSGILSSSIEINGEKGFVQAIMFPTASDIFGSKK